MCAGTAFKLGGSQQGAHDRGCPAGTCPGRGMGGRSTRGRGRGTAAGGAEAAGDSPELSRRCTGFLAGGDRCSHGAANHPAFNTAYSHAAASLHASAAAWIADTCVFGLHAMLPAVLCTLQHFPDSCPWHIPPVKLELLAVGTLPAVQATIEYFCCRHHLRMRGAGVRALWRP